MNHEIANPPTSLPRVTYAEWNKCANKAIVRWMVKHSQHLHPTDAYPITEDIPEQVEDRNRYRDGCAYALRKMQRRERIMTKDYFFNEMSLDEVATKHGISRERVRQLINRGARRVRYSNGTCIHGMQELMEFLYCK